MLHWHVVCQTNAFDYTVVCPSCSQPQTVTSLQLRDGIINTTQMSRKVNKLITVTLAFCVGFKLSNMFQNTCSVLDDTQQHNFEHLHTDPKEDASLGTVYSHGFKLTLPESEPLYSSVRVSSLYGMNFATARNICVKPDHSKKFFVYSDSNIPAIDFKRRSGFNYGWEFSVLKGTIPPACTRVYGTTIIISPAYTKHVTHFAESSIPIWHALSEPSRYPVHSTGDRIFLKQSNFKEELEWNQKILVFLAHHTQNSTIIDVSSFQSSSMVCFEKAGMVGMGLHEFGFFANEDEARTFRRGIVSYYRIPMVAKSSLLHKSRW